MRTLPHSARVSITNTFCHARDTIYVLYISVGSRVSYSEKMREVKLGAWEYDAREPPGINYFWFVLLFMFVFA